MDTFAQHLLHHNDSVVYDENAKAVTLVTLLTLKGLEFKVVFIAGIEKGLLPINFRHNDPTELSAQHVEKERRLNYLDMMKSLKNKV